MTQWAGATPRLGNLVDAVTSFIVETAEGMELDSESRRNYEHWRRNGLLNIKPDSRRFGEFPEGCDVTDVLRRHVASLPHEKIVDLGCGYGRLCRAFDPNKYLGLDISPSAIEVAQKAHPHYRFQRVAYTEDDPPADIYLAYTVFLHISWEPLQEIVRTICRSAQWIVVAEILGSHGLDDGRRCVFEPHRVYSRTKRECQELLAGCGFFGWEEIRRRYYYYGRAEISFLIFRRDEPPPSRLSLPEGLQNPRLQFDGSYEDGWTARVFSVLLSRGPGSQLLRIVGLFPGIDSRVLRAGFRVQVEGQNERLFEITPGPFAVAVPVDAASGMLRITAHFDTSQRLPDPDGREVSVLLKTIGF